MIIRINKLHFPVIVLGPGRRIGIWLQGCSIRCPGCCSRDTWDAAGGGDMSVDAIIRWCKVITNGELDGVTISGGEPFEQPAALGALLAALSAWKRNATLSFDVLVYTGKSRRYVERHFTELIALIDVIIPEPFRARLPTNGILFGSMNQSPWFVNEAVEEKFRAWMDREATSPRRRIQMTVDDSGIWMVGIPRAEELKRLEKDCLKGGLVLEKPSWRA